MTPVAKERAGASAVATALAHHSGPAPAGSTEDRPLLLIPAYEPLPSLPDVLAAALAGGAFAGAIVVDDGSSEHCAPIFEACRVIESVTVVRHAQNRGKGAALKTGLELAARDPRVPGVVTADADGQHLPSDIVKVADALQRNPEHMILGARSFGPEVPLRSRFGNLMTCKVLGMVTGQRLSDTQTGLRAIPRSLIPQLLAISSNGYEFELDALLRCRGPRVIEEVTIETVYLDGNLSSHFDPILDSMRIYLVLLRFFFASLASALVDNVVFALAFLVIPNIALCQFLGRTISAGVNFTLNRKAVFLSTDEVRRTLPRYLGLVVLSGALSYGVIAALHALGMPVLPAKLLAESVLFLFNFVALRSIVFAR
jgi:glycosyltransferase involved in cell wall biosynthesis